MALSDIIQKILADAKKQAEEITKKANIEAEKIAADNQVKIEEMKKQKQQEAVDKEMAMEKKTETLIHSEKKNLFLNKKRIILEKVFEEAKKQFANLSDNEAEKIMIVAFAGINEENGTIYPAKGKTGLVKKAMKNCGKSYDISDEKDFSNGFLFVGKNIDINCSFDAIIDREIRPQIELEIAQSLFTKI